MKHHLKNRLHNNLFELKPEVMDRPAEIEAYTDSLIVSNQGVGAVKIEGRAMNYQRNNDGIGSIDDKKLKIGM